MTVEEFDSGAVRDSQEGKPRFDLITPSFKLDLAKMLGDKGRHYGDRNWEKGIETARTFSSLLRHVEALGRGEWLDEESGHPHTVLAAANLMFIHEFHGTEFDTLHELVGPSLRTTRNTPSPCEVIINFGDPEPNRNWELEDIEGDLMWYDRYKGGWTYGMDAEPWGDFSDYFPLVRVK